MSILLSNKILTIVIVTYNPPIDELEKTLVSILNQTWNDYEVLIIDGGSEGSIIECISLFANDCNKKGIGCRVISEPDQGIYDAMNKGIKYAEGDWIIYINAGDYLYKCDVLESIEVYLERGNEDVIYGNIVAKDGEETQIFKPRLLKRIKKEIPFCHQAVFTKRTAMRQGFDISYTLCADYDFYLGAYIGGMKFRYVDQVISYYSLDGVSSQNMVRLRNEIYDIRKKYGTIRISKSMYLIYHSIRANIRRRVPRLALEATRTLRKVIRGR